MYSVSIKKDIYDIYILSDDLTSSVAEICPARGGILRSFVSKGTELLYLDQTTFNDPLKNIRGGNPILFPICGQLPDERYSFNDRGYFMKNHGFARNNPWTVLDYGVSPFGSAAFLKIGLTSTLETLDCYPFDFRLVFTYTLCNGKLTISQSITNTTCCSCDTDNSKMPVQTGFHPYFKMLGKQLCHNIKSRECFDYNDMQSKNFPNPYDASDKAEAVVVRPETSECIDFYELNNPDCKIRLTYSPQYKYIMLWAQDGSDFICVEPWTARNQEFLRGDELILVESGQKINLFMSIERI